MNLTAMSIVRAAVTERAAGEVAEDATTFDGTGLGKEEALSERLIRKQARAHGLGEPPPRGQRGGPAVPAGGGVHEQGRAPEEVTQRSNTHPGPGLTSRTRHNAVATPSGRQTGWRRPKAKRRRPKNELAISNRGETK